MFNSISLSSVKREFLLPNKIINIVKFYYETVLQMPNRFYSIDRPFKEDRIPKAIGKAEVQKYSK